MLGLVQGIQTPCQEHTNLPSTRDEKQHMCSDNVSMLYANTNWPITQHELGLYAHSKGNIHVLHLRSSRYCTTRVNE